MLLKERKRRRIKDKYRIAPKEEPLSYLEYVWASTKGLNNSIHSRHENSFEPRACNDGNPPSARLGELQSIMHDFSNG